MSIRSLRKSTTTCGFIAAIPLSFAAADATSSEMTLSCANAERASIGVKRSRYQQVGVRSFIQDGSKYHSRKFGSTDKRLIDSAEEASLIRIETWNVQGIKDKWDLLAEVVDHQKVDILGVTEHWLKEGDIHKLRHASRFNGLVKSARKLEQQAIGDVKM